MIKTHYDKLIKIVEYFSFAVLILFGIVCVTYPFWILLPGAISAFKIIFGFVVVVVFSRAGLVFVINSTNFLILMAVFIFLTYPTFYYLPDLFGFWLVVIEIGLALICGLFANVTLESNS